MLQEQAFTTHYFNTAPRVKQQIHFKAVSLERQNGLMNYLDALSDFILLNHERWCQPNDIAVRRFGKKSVIAKPQTHLPGVIV